MKLLHVIPSILPHAGGTATVVRSLALAQTKQGDSVEILTLDPPGDPIEGLCWQGCGPAFLFYGWSAKLRKWLRDKTAKYDLVIVHGLWQYSTYAVRKECRKAGVPYLVFTHGMLDPWFKRTYPLKHLKKWPYWLLVEHSVLRDAARVIYTTEAERIKARESFSLYQASECVVPLGVSRPLGESTSWKMKFEDHFSDLKGKRFILYLGRIHPKKGPDLILQAMKNSSDSAEFDLAFAGPFSDHAFEAEMRALASALPPEIQSRIHWLGLLEGEIKWGALASAEAFILPSHQENFGLAVVEALSVGTPVLLSTAIDLAPEIEEAGVGFVEEDTVEGTGRLLSRWSRLTISEKEALRSKAQIFYQERYTLEKSVTALNRVLVEVLQ